MKRSKIFLGVSTGVLAIVAFTAAKVAKFTKAEPGYYKLSGRSACTAFVSSSQPSGYLYNGVNGDKQIKSGTQVLFSYNAGACTNALYTQGIAD